MYGKKCVFIHVRSTCGNELKCYKVCKAFSFNTPCLTAPVKKKKSSGVQSGKDGRSAEDLPRANGFWCALVRAEAVCCAREDSSERLMRAEQRQIVCTHN